MSKNRDRNRALKAGEFWAQRTEPLIGEGAKQDGVPISVPPSELRLDILLSPMLPSHERAKMVRAMGLTRGTPKSQLDPFEGAERLLARADIARTHEVEQLKGVRAPHTGVSQFKSQLENAPRGALPGVGSFSRLFVGFEGVLSNLVGATFYDLERETDPDHVTDRKIVLIYTAKNDARTSVPHSTARDVHYWLAQNTFEGVIAWDNRRAEESGVVGNIVLQAVRAARGTDPSYHLSFMKEGWNAVATSIR